MEVLVLIDFEGTMDDELTVRAGDVVKDVKMAGEDGWLEGELRGKRGIFPSNFVKEVPVHLMGDNNRQPRSLRKCTVKMQKEQSRKCEVTFTYTPVHPDELELVVGETIEVLREIEDGWWMGKKNGKIGAFPSNFVKEIFVQPKDTKLNEVKSRPKLSDAVFNSEGSQQQRASIRKKTNVKECYQVLFDYKAIAEDELDLKKGDIVTVLNKATEDDGWWEGELNGRRGFFPDNFVMLIPTDPVQLGTKSQPPQRLGSQKKSVKQTSGMDKSSTEAKGKVETKDEKADAAEKQKDFRSDPPGKIKLPGLFIKSPPPPIKDKPQKFFPKHDDQPTASPKQTESKAKDSEQFNGVDISTDKLIHPTANRAKPPQRRLPTATTLHAPNDTNHDEASTEADGANKKLSVPPKVTENHVPLSKTEQHPAPPATKTEMKTVEIKAQEEKPTLDQVVAELKELRTALELLRRLHETNLQEIKDELNEERNKRMKLQDEVQVLKRQK